MYSHDLITHTKEEIDLIISRILRNQDYVKAAYYLNAAKHKDEKMLSRSYITAVVRWFDPSKETFKEYFMRKYKGDFFYSGPDSTYSVYHCDNNNEFYMYINHKDDRILLFSCDCQ